MTFKARGGGGLGMGVKVSRFEKFEKGPFQSIVVVVQEVFRSFLVFSGLIFFVDIGRTAG